MKSENVLKSQIRSSMLLKTTEELVEIWQMNDRNEWSPEAFQVVKELLIERLGTLPKQQYPSKDVTDSQESANKLLVDHQRKLSLYLLLDLGLYLCIPFAFLFLFGIVMSIASWLSPDSVRVVGFPSWYAIMCALLIVPIFILRRQAKAKHEVAKSALLKLITKGLQEK